MYGKFVLYHHYHNEFQKETCTHAYVRWHRCIVYLFIYICVCETDIVFWYEKIEREHRKMLENGWIVKIAMIMQKYHDRRVTHQICFLPFRYKRKVLLPNQNKRGGSERGKEKEQKFNYLLFTIASADKRNF